MSLYRYKLMLVLGITLILTLMMPAIGPKIRLLYFAPLLVIAYYQKPLVYCTTLALCCGLVLDLLAADARFGIHAMNFSLTTLLLFPQRKHFFADKISTLPIMVFFFSVISTTIEISLQHAMQRSPNYSWEWFVCDMVLMPGFDALYAMAVFTLPPLFLLKRPKTGKDYFSS